MDAHDPNSFLGVKQGPDSALKIEIEDIMRNLFYQLDTLSNFHFTPKPPQKEATITTQNVPAIMLEDAIPIGVSQGQTKTPKEVYNV